MGLQSDAASTFSRILKRIVDFYFDARAADYFLLLLFVAPRTERRIVPVADQSVYDAQVFILTPATFPT
jgi:hypothetical protein